MSSVMSTEIDGILVVVVMMLATSSIETED